MDKNVTFFHLIIIALAIVGAWFVIGQISGKYGRGTPAVHYGPSEGATPIQADKVY